MAAPTSALASPGLHASRAPANQASRRAEVRPAAAPVRPAGPGSMAWLRPLEQGLNRAIEWLARAPAKQALAGLSDHLLEDIGLTRDDIARRDPRSHWPQ